MNGSNSNNKHLVNASQSVEQITINRPLPLPLTSPLSINRDDIIPQPPIRHTHLRSSLNRNNTVTGPTPPNDAYLSPVFTKSNSHQISSNQQNATNEVTKLVYKSAGSVTSLNISNQDVHSNRNLVEKTVLVNNTKIQDISGVISNKESRDELRTNLAVEQMSPMNKSNIITSTTSPSASNHFSHNYKQSSSSPVNVVTSTGLPWIPLGGEEFPKDKESKLRLQIDFVTIFLKLLFYFLKVLLVIFQLCLYYRTIES